MGVRDTAEYTTMHTKNSPVQNLSEAKVEQVSLEVLYDHKHLFYYSRFDNLQEHMMLNRKIKTAAFVFSDF